jgi:hypothetical protein
MNVEPQKWFVGLMDFFSILLPGAVLTYLMRDRIGSMVLGDPYSALTGVEAWAVFLVSSYLAGHAVFLVGSWLDHPYDWLRGYTINTQIALLAREGRLLPWPLRTLVAVVFKEERNLAVDSAVRIKRHVLEPLGAQSAVNAFQWCKSTLTLASPESLATVQRFEADSKFFRCLVIVLLVLEIVWMSEGNWRLAVMGIALITLALWR